MKHKPNSKIIANKIKTIWNSSAEQILITNELKNEALNFAYSEWREGIDSLWNSFESKWINHPVAIQNCSNRLKQLKIANKVGLRIPKTIITNDPSAFMKFF